MHPEVEHALFSELWGYVTRALHNEDFDQVDFDLVNALESEMAGHVLSYRLARGWLVREASAPAEFQSFSAIVSQGHE